MKAFIILLVSGISAFPFLLNKQSSMQESPMYLDTKEWDLNAWKPAEEGDVRSPCPMINTLANHQILPHSGQKITSQVLFSALNEFLGFEKGIAQTLTDVAFKEPFGYDQDGTRFMDLNELQIHGAIEHDASLSRLDSAVGNNTEFNEKVFNQIYDYSKDGYMTIRQLASFRHLREKQSKESHPDSYNGGFKTRTAASAEAAALFSVFEEEKVMRMDWIKIFFEQERFPIELGWETRKISTTSLLAKTLEISTFSWF